MSILVLTLDLQGLAAPALLLLGCTQVILIKLQMVQESLLDIMPDIKIKAVRVVRATQLRLDSLQGTAVSKTLLLLLVPVPATLFNPNMRLRWVRQPVVRRRAKLQSPLGIMPAPTE